MSHSRSRSRSRSPVRDDSQEPYDIDSAPEDNYDDQPPSSDCRRFHIDNYPSRWSYQDIKQFIKDRTNSSVISDAIKYVNCSKYSNKNSYTTSMVEFTDSNTCKQAYQQLKGRQNEKCQGNIILIRWKRNNNSSQSSNRNSRTSSNSAKNNYNNKNNVFKPSKAQVTLDTYGLSKEFLDHLGVKLPILNKIFIANLDRQVDEAKLREVFGNAGQIMDIFMINVKENKAKMAKLEFDHPLEAVQAISMFHQQELYGRPMLVQIDNSPNLHSKPLPVGLTSIGPGLGPDGAPMRGVRYQAEIQPLKELINVELQKILSLINPADRSITQTDMMMNPAMNVQAMTPLNINTMNAFNQPMPVVNPFASNPQGMQNLQLLQGLLQQNSGNDLTATLAALQAQNMAPNLLSQNFTGQTDWNGAMFGQQAQMKSSDNSGSSKGGQSFFDSSRKSYEDNRSSNFDKHSQNSEDREKNMMTTDMLIFNNLPSSVSLSALKSKMREVGDIKFAEITDEGKAIVRFCRGQDAERCVKLFDRSKVDGQTIQVRFF